VSQLRRKRVPSSAPQTLSPETLGSETSAPQTRNTDTPSQPGEYDQQRGPGVAAEPARHSGDRQHPDPPLAAPRLAPLRFAAELVEPALPEELLGPMGSMNGNGSHSA
ncbi:MAG: hypothetical protein ACRDPW_11225, partial [Mycobacteriales bacterium]